MNAHLLEIGDVLTRHENLPLDSLIGDLLRIVFYYLVNWTFASLN